MAKVTSLTITDSGFGYTSAPIITISPPDTDSADATGTVNVTNEIVTSVTLTDSGQYYTSVPGVTFSLPTADSVTATGTLTIDSSTGAINSVTITDSGAYYITEPLVAISGNTGHNPPDPRPKNFSTTYKKFGTYSYGLRTDTPFNVNEDLTQFDGDDYLFNNSLEFWVYPAITTANGTLFFLPHTYDTNGDDSRVDINGLRINWHWTESNGASGGQITMASNLLNHNQWNFIQLVKILRSDGNVDHQIYVNGSLGPPGYQNYSENRPKAAQDHFVQDKIVLNNSQASVQFIYLDCIRFVGYDSTAIEPVTIFPPSNIPDSDRDPGAGLGGDIRTNYEGFELYSPSITASITNGKISSLLLEAGGNRFTEAPTITIDDPTGVPSDFRATGTAVVDSDNGGAISSITITSGGNFYDSSPVTITIDSATGNKTDYTATGTVSIDSLGQVDSIGITYAGGGYTSAPTVTIKKPVFTNINQNDSANQTLASGVKISGEVVKYSDSDGKLYLAHVGADDGKYHTFVAGRNITFGNKEISYTRNVLAVSEDNKISANEQNLDFTTQSTDFLDFTETNPFGDPENN